MPSIPKPRLRRSGRVAPGTTPAPERVEPQVEIVETTGPQGLRWINIPHYGAPEREWLEEHFDFHPLDYEDLRSRNQRPKVDDYDDYLFVVLQFPRFDKEVGRLNAAELDVFVGPDYVITVPGRQIAALDYLFERCRGDDEFRDQLFGKGTGYLLYRIVDDSVDASFPMLRKIGAKLEGLEDSVFEGRSNEVVRELFTAKQEVINFRTIVRPMRPALVDLERTTSRYIADDLEMYFDDINDASERVWDILENFKEVVEALEETNESVLSHQLNNILRILTAFSVILLPLTLIASIFGMNVDVPGQGQIGGFWIIIGVMAVLLGGMLWAFRRRGIL
ncbi:MAG: magnesium transporter CorA family protein [Solirubrobacterales bacterium]